MWGNAKNMKKRDKIRKLSWAQAKFRKFRAISDHEGVEIRTWVKQVKVSECPEDSKNQIKKSKIDKRKNRQEPP